ncbi:hypothetical protein ACFLWN_02820 [Chloroflexota bacterium]
MRRLLTVLLFVVILTICFVPQVVAKETSKTTVHTIVFDNLVTGSITIWERGQSYHWNMEGQHLISFEGILKEKDGLLYLSPMKGTMSINDAVYDLEYDIKIAPIKEGEPLFYDQGFGNDQHWRSSVAINIGGEKGTGTIDIYSPGYINPPQVFTMFIFDAIVDGRYLQGIIGKDAPTVDGETWPYN